MKGNGNKVPAKVPGTKFLDKFLSRKTVPGTFFTLLSYYFFYLFDFFDFEVNTALNSFAVKNLITGVRGMGRGTSAPSRGVTQQIPYMPGAQKRPLYTIKARRL
jgi:hypothetical protein